MQNVVISLPVNGLCGSCLSVWGPEPYTPLTNCIPVYSIPITPWHTMCAYTVYLITQGRGETLTCRERWVATVHKVGSENTNMTDCISSL